MPYDLQLKGVTPFRRTGKKISEIDRKKSLAKEQTSFRNAEDLEVSPYTKMMMDNGKRKQLFDWFDSEVLRLYGNPATYDIDFTSKSGKILDKVQRDLVSKSISASRVLLDVEVGVGKTLISLVSARNVIDSNGGKCLIICEKKLITYWREEVEIEEIDADIFNYEYFIRVAEGREPKFKIEDYSVLIIDESHYRANLETRATKAMLQVLKDYTSYTFCLTATPVRNTLEDYLAQLKFIKHPLGILDMTAFRVMFKILNGHLPDIERFKRLTKDVVHKATLKDAGIDIKVRLHQVFVNMPEDHRKVYNYLQQSTRILEVRYGNKIIPISTNKKKMEVLCAEAKIDFTVSLIDQLNKKGKSAVVISNYNEKVLDVMADKIGTEVFKAGNRNKDSLMKDFQQGKKSYLLAQRKIAQSGLNLQNSSCIILHDLHYSLDFLIQSIGRVKRRGQKEDAVDIYIPFCRDTDETHIWDVLQEKWERYLLIS